MGHAFTSHQNHEFWLILTATGLCIVALVLSWVSYRSRQDIWEETYGHKMASPHLFGNVTSGIIMFMKLHSAGKSKWGNNSNWKVIRHQKLKFPSWRKTGFKKWGTWVTNNRNEYLSRNRCFRMPRILYKWAGSIGRKSGYGSLLSRSDIGMTFLAMALSMRFWHIFL